MARRAGVSARKALAALRASLKADPTRASAQEAWRIAESFERCLNKCTAVEGEVGRCRSGAVVCRRATAARRGRLRRRNRTADQAAASSDRSVAENLGAYQMPGKAQGFLARGHAQAAAIAGAALFSVAT